ncbi:unnamed protein product [Scytosiphon promiscuus]
MASPRKLSPLKCGALGLAAVLLVPPAEVYGFVSTSGGLSCWEHESHRRSSRGAWGSRQQGAHCAALVQKTRQRSFPLATTPDGVEGPEGVAGENSETSASTSTSTSSSSDNGGDQEEVWARAELPMSNDVQVEQATRAVWKALSDGKNRQILRLSLPLIGATEMDDWPGGDRQRYKACGPMVDTLLRGNPAAKEGASVIEQILDESDAVGLMQLQCKEAKDDASAMIFPTTDTLPMQQQVTAGAGSRLVALVNPAWKSPSDFGLFKSGEAKKALAEFEVTYSLQSLVVYGYTCRLLYSYPGPWRLFLVGEDTGKRELLGSWDAPPPNEEVEKAVFDKKGRPNASERVQASAKFFQDGM